jgi:hypothetical protein
MRSMHTPVQAKRCRYWLACCIDLSQTQHDGSVLGLLTGRVPDEDEESAVLDAGT